MPEAEPLPLLWSPARIGRATLRNRFVLTGHGTGMGRDFRPDDQLVAYYEERAKGGVALIMLGSQQVHPTSPGITNLLCNYDDGIIPGLRRIADAVHRHGGLVFGYLSHMGLASSARPLPLWSASAVYDQKYGEVAHEMTEAEMAELVAAFCAAARRNIEAGLDGIEVHCGHGLLLNQFLSPLTNRRRDGFGGSAENRLRFPSWVLREVREAIGPDVPLGIRCSGDELIEGGLHLDEMKRIAVALVEAGGLDYVDVSAGNDGDAVSNMLHEPPMGLPAAPFAHLARGIRDVVTVPVIHGTRINNAAAGEALLAAGDADFVGMCRALIADPHLPNKARTGSLSAVNPCIACEQACLGRLHRGRHISCIGNPVTGRELQWADGRRAEKPRRLVVVGGGPAGLEAAGVASKLGHSVVLFEALSELGGKLNLARRAPTRQEWADLLDHKIGLVHERGVDVRTGHRAGVEDLLRERPDMIVIATGSRAARPSLPGADGERVFGVEEVLAGAELGRRVIVLDFLNRQPGLTTACYLADRGHEVAIATDGTHVGHKLESQNLTFLYQQLMRRGVALLPHMAVTAIEGGDVRFRNSFTREPGISGGWDSIVLAYPGASEAGLARELEARRCEVPVSVIGDSYTPRDVEAAILEGHRAARSL